MKFEASKRYCYVQGEILRIFYSDAEADGALDAWMSALAVPGKPAHLKRLSADQKRAAIDQQVDSLRRAATSPWHGIEPGEVLAAILCRELPPRYRSLVFGAVKKEAALKAPVAAWLRAKGFAPYAERDTGTKRTDLVGWKKGGLLSSDRLIVVELKNHVDQLKRGLDQMTTFAEHAHEVYLACTPDMAAEYLQKHANSRSVRRWDPELLNNKLRAFGFGLLLVWKDDVDVVLPARAGQPRAEKVNELLSELRKKDPLE